MERLQCLNKIELQGRIGRISITKVGDGKLHASFSVATNYAYKDMGGNAVIETTWHNCTAFQSNKISVETLNKLEKGMSVNLKGRLRNHRYTDTEGTERTTYDVFVNELTILDGVAID